MNKIKRILSLILIFALLGSMMVFPASAANDLDAQLRLVQEEGKYKAVLRISTPSPVNLTLFEAWITYDSSVVSFDTDEIKRARGFSEYIYDAPEITDGSEKLLYVNGMTGRNGVSTEGGLDVVTIPFELVGGNSVDSITTTTIRLEESRDSALAKQLPENSIGILAASDLDRTHYVLAASALYTNNVGYSFYADRVFANAQGPDILTKVTLEDQATLKVMVDGTNEGSHTVHAKAINQNEAEFNPGSTRPAVTWRLEQDGSRVALQEALSTELSIKATGNATGEITIGNGAPEGTYRVIATSEDVEKYAILEIGHQPSSTATLQLSIAEPVITLGHSAQLTLAGQDQFENPFTPSGVTYTVDPANSGVTVSSSGTVQAALTATLGTYRIQATANGVSSNVLTITVQDKPTMTITGHTVASKEYDGQPATLSGTASAMASTGPVDLTNATRTVVYKESTGRELGNTAPKDAGTYTVDVTYETPDYIGTQSIDFTISPKELTISGLAAENRAYDGTRQVKLTYSVDGKVSGDDVEVLLEGSIDSKNAGDAIPVTVNAALTGTAQKNYTFDRDSLPSLTVNISKAQLSIDKVTVAEKTYNGTADAVVESITFTGTVAGEVSQPTYTVAGAAFDSADVADATEVTGTVTLTGDFAANYELAKDDFTVAATITPADYSVQMPYETLTIKTGTTGVNALVGQNVKAIPNVAGEAIADGDVDFALNKTDDEISALNAGTHDLEWTCEVNDSNYTSRPKSGTFTLVVTANDPVNIEIGGKPDAAVTYGDRDFQLTAEAFRVKDDGTTETVDNADFTWTAAPRGIVEIDNDGNVTVVGAGTATITVTALSASQTYTLEVLKKPITVTMEDITASFDDDIDALLDFDVDPDELVSGDTKADLKITYDINTKDLSAGTYPIGGSSRSENYDVTIIPGLLTVEPGQMDDAAVTGRTQSNPAEADPSVTIDLSTILNKIKGNFTVGTPDITVRNGMATTAEFDMTKKTLTVKYNPQPANTESTIVIPVYPVNYNNFTITVTLTAVDKEFVEVHFDDLTVEYNGSAHKLAEAYVEIDGNRVTQGITYDPHGATASDLPEYTAVGTYPVTATYESDTHFGTKTATLRITDSLLPSVRGTTPTEDVRDQDRNAGGFTVNVNPSATGEYVIALRGTKVLESYERDGQRHEWVGLLVGLQKSGNDQSSFYFGSSEATMTRVSGFADGVPFGGNGKEMILWIPVDQCPKDYFIGDGNDVVKLTFTFSEYSPVVNANSGSGSGATHETKIFGNGGSSSTSTNKTKPNDDNTSISRGTVVTSVEPNVSVDNGTVSVKVDASTVTNRLNENEKVADYEDKKDTAIQVKTSGSKSAVTSTAITMDTASINAISRARTALWLTTDSGNVKIGYNGLSELYDQAGGDTIVFTIGTAANGLLEVSAVSGGAQLSDLGGSAADVTVDYKNGTYYVYLVGEGALDASGNVVDPTKLTLVATGVRATGGELNFTTRLLGQLLITQTQYDNVPKAAATFSDVPSSHWAIDAINDLASRGIVAGMGNGTFAPDAQVTREQFVRMLAGVSNEQQPTTTASRFTDVSSTAWSLAYIEWAADRGITYGKTATTFEPTSPISRQEMASMIYRYIQNSGKELPKTNSALAFNDQSEIGSWAADSVAVMQQAGIINGVAVNGGFEFRPTNAATRAECAAMLSALIKLL